MEHTQKEYELQADAILATFEWEIGNLNNFFNLNPKYNVKISETGLSAKFYCYFTNEEDREDKIDFTLLKTDTLKKLISNVQDHYYILNKI